MTAARTGIKAPVIERRPGEPGGTSAAAVPDAPSIFTAFVEQLGLRLVSAGGPVEVLVIDHVERPTKD